jgi:hypothetical protein
MTEGGVHGRALTVACVYVLSRRYGLLESKRKDGERLADNVGFGCVRRQSS